jgi:hypothetical protein
MVSGTMDSEMRREQALGRARDLARSSGELLSDYEERKERNASGLGGDTWRRPEPEPVIRRTHTAPATPARNGHASITKGWQDYIDKRVEKRITAAIGGIGGAVGDSIGRERVAIQAALDRRDERFAELQRQHADLLLRVMNLEGQSRETVGILPSLSLVKGGRRDAA